MLFVMPLFRKPNERVSGDDLLARVVRERMPGADDETQRLVVSVCGLVASVVYADRQYTPEEQAQVRKALSHVHGLDAAGVDAVCEVLEKHMVQIATINPQKHTRELRDLTDVEFRREVLDLLLELAAADDKLTLVETDLLRRTASAMGLTQDDYLHAQAKHKDKIGLLR